MPTFSTEIYSPRWGHNDTYNFEFDQATLTIRFGPRVGTCTWQDGRDPVWTGESWEDMLRNDSIYPPGILQDLIEHLWKAWRNGDIRTDAVNNELQAVITWLNQITSAKPRTEFWRKYF